MPRSRAAAAKIHSPPYQTDIAAADCAAEPTLFNTLPEERDFYEAHAWCLNPFLTVREAIDRLREQAERLKLECCDWRTHERATNIFLLGGALLNTVDEYLRGPTLRLPRRLVANPLGRRSRLMADKARAALRHKELAEVVCWRERWLPGFSDFLSVAIVNGAPDQMALVGSARRLAALSGSALPAGLRAQRIGVPSPFRRMDLSQFDVIALGRRFVARFPDRSQAILLVGLCTSGSYFAPLLYSFLRMEGFSTVSMLTLQPDKGAGPLERRELEHCAKQGYLALVVDDPPLTGGTLLLAFDIARNAGFAPSRLKALVPVHSEKRDWYKPLPDDFVVSLQEEDWYKRQQLTPEAAWRRLSEYFQNGRLISVDVVDQGEAGQINAGLGKSAKDWRGTRLKRIFEVRLGRFAAQDEYALC